MFCTTFFTFLNTLFQNSQSTTLILLFQRDPNAPPPKQRTEEEEEEYQLMKAKLAGKGKGKGKKGKDPNAPKRPMGAYFLFMNDHRDATKAENPGLKIGEIAKLLGQKWANIEKEEKEKYESLPRRLRLSMKRQRRSMM